VPPVVAATFGSTTVTFRDVDECASHRNRATPGWPPCHRADIEGRWATTMHFCARPTLLEIDEFGYLPPPAEAASALFQVVSQRYL
jgi:hypothetical protein